MAAGKVDTRQLKVFDDTCRAGYEPGDAKSTARFVDANKAFHVAIAHATDNVRLATAIEQLLNEMTRLLNLGLRLRRSSQGLPHEHKGLLKALARGDGEAAERICGEHIEASRNTLLSVVLTSPAMTQLGIAIDGA
jgi:DNA-binding GntR family transcriptional regulator